MTRRLVEVLRACEKRDVILAAKPLGLSVQGELTPELREDLKANKPNLLHFLKTGNCHHELKPEECAVCSGYVRRLIEEGGDGG